MATTRTIDELEDVLAKIPLARAMQIRIAEYSAGRLRLAAPAKPNLNHFGIAFGGAIECLGTLAGWGLLWLELDDPRLRIVIQRAETSLRKPLDGDLAAIIERPGVPDWEPFRRQLERRGRARLDLTARIGDGEQPDGARFQGRYAVALASPD